MAAIGTLPVLLDGGTHAGRPAASDVGVGGLYSCTDHSLIYQTDGSSWATWATLGSSSGIPDTILNAKGDIIAATAADTADRLAVGTNGFALVADSTQSTGLKYAFVGQGNRDYAFARRASTDITCNSTSWANLDTGLDLTLTAASGDIIEVSASGAWNNQSPFGALDVATIVSAAPVNYISGGGGASDLGISGWGGAASVTTIMGASVMYTLQAGDISSGTVLLRLRYRTNSAANKVLNATTVLPFHWSAKNLGPAL